MFDVDEGSGTVFRDVIFLALAGFVAIVMLLLPHVNPPAEDSPDRAQPGNVIVEIRWPDEANADVDLWVQAPGDVPVGYSNKGGVVFNLLRDDLGLHSDFSGLNTEVSYSRGVPDGRYIVNLHMYRNVDDHFPLEVLVVVSIKKDPDSAAVPIQTAKVYLRKEGQELTVFQFRLENKALVKGTVHDTPAKIRSAP
jgi:hypothetical protein